MTMPINRLLKEGAYTPEQIALLKQPFDLALRQLGLVDRNDPICEIIARKIIELGKEAAHDAKQIAALAVKLLGP